MDTKDLEKRFLDDQKIGIVCCQLGVKHSGKSVFASGMISYFLKNDIYDSFHLFIPCYRNESKNTYAFLEQLSPKNDKKVIIYENFSLTIIQDIMNKSKTDKKRRFIWIEDGTSFGELFNDRSNILKDLITKNRHYRTSLFLTIHHHKSILHPSLRSQINWFFLMRQPNKKVLETIFEENMSLYYEKSDWLNLCRDRMKTDGFPIIAVDKDRGDVDCKAEDWKSFKTEMTYILNVSNRYISRKNDKTSVQSNRTEIPPESGRHGGEIQKNESFKTANKNTDSRQFNPSRKIISQLLQSTHRN
jgi:hypothetical protein